MSEEKALVRPYTHLLEGRDPAEVMRATPARLARVLASMTPEQIEFKPTEHKWSVREILCHLTDCELVWAWRLRLIYGTDTPSLQPFEQDSWARIYVSPGYTAEAARSTWVALRRWNLALIEGLREDEKSRPAHHPELGDITLWNVVEIAAGHDVHHMDQLEKVAARVSGGAAQ